MFSFKILLLTTLIGTIFGRINIDPFYGLPKALEGDYNTTTFD